MSITDIKEAQKTGNVIFGLKRILKFTQDKKNKKSGRIFISRDTRPEILKELESHGMEFETLKTKTEVSKELGLEFENEVILIK